MNNSKNKSGCLAGQKGTFFTKVYGELYMD